MSPPPTDPADDLVPEVYDELRALASRYMRRPGQTLQATALVHEAYLRLAGTGPARWRSESHFSALAAKVMRDVLVDEERARRAQKRGGDRARVTLLTDTPGASPVDVDVLALHEALERLAAEDPDQARIVELRFFGGMTGAEIAEAMGVSRRTVVRELKMAQAWLLRELQRGGTRGGPA